MDDSGRYEVRWSEYRQAWHTWDTWLCLWVD